MEYSARQAFQDWGGHVRRWLQNEYGLALALALAFLATFVLWHFSARASLIGLGLGGAIGAVALLQWPIVGVFYVSFSIFGHVASIFPGIDTMIALLTLSAYAARKLLCSDLEWRFPAAARWAALWLAWSGASIAWAANTEQGLEMLVMHLKGFLVFLLILEAAQSYRRIIHIVLAGLAGVLFAVFISAYTGYKFFVSGAAAELSRFVTVETTRLYGLWSDPNFFALTLLTLSGVALALWRTRLALTTRLLAAGGFAAVFVGVAISLSRGALLSAFVALAFCIWVERKRLRLLLFVGSVVVLVLTFLPIGLAERMGTLVSTSGHGTLEDRERLMRGGIEMAIQAFPFGVGLGNYWYHSVSYTTMNTRMISHSSYIDLVAEGGIMSLLLFGGFAGSLFQATRAGRRRFHPAALADNLAIGLRISLVAFLLGATFLNATAFWSFWWLAGLISAKVLCDRKLVEGDAMP